MKRDSQAAESADQPSGSSGSTGSGDSADTGGGPVEGSAEVEPTPAKPGGASQHTVEKGDTLWDLSQKYLGSPWYWPKVWSYNPEIANPHWIYPGNQVRFLPTGEEVPTQVEVGTGPQTPDDVEPVAMVDEDRVEVTKKDEYIPGPGVNVRLEGFATPKEVEEAGTISGSYSEALILSVPDQMYVTFKKSGAVKVGERYVIFRTVKRVYHPTTGDDFGYLTHVIGTAVVARWSEKEKVATLTIVGDWDDIQRGDLVGPAGENMVRRVAPRPNDKELQGTIMIASRFWYKTFGEHEQLLVDKGSDQGVQVGNTFTIYRRMNGANDSTVLYPEKLDMAWPKEDVGACMAIEVKAKATVCILTRSMREIVEGDHVELRVGGARAER